jgi:IS5 family transposase
MAVEHWKPSVKITRQEQYLLKRCQKNRKLFVFLREHRHEIFDEEIEQELEAMYRDTGAGKEPLWPELMAMALILQGYHGVSDAEAVELTVVDLRWQMVLDRLGQTEAAFSQGALFDFRERLIEHDMDRRLLERTAAVARSSKGFDYRKLPKTLRIAIDSSPLHGAGRVEDTINLIGHAARKVVRCIAELLGWEFERVCRETGIELLMAKSIKRALDRDWSDPKQKAEAVDVLARQVLSLERWIEQHLAEQAGHPPLDKLLATLRQVMEQDLEPDPNGGGVRIARGVAQDRRISVEDGEMRHGRKSKSKRIDGYKRHAGSDLDSDAIVACALTPANVADSEALPDIKGDVDRQGIRLDEVHIDRGYMCDMVREFEAEGTTVVCKPWKATNGDLFTKDDFSLDLRSKTITCPAGHIEPIEFGKTVEFQPSVCAACPLRDKCTTAALGSGRTVTIAKDERFQKRMRQMSKTRSGRNRFRDRVAVEHRLAHIGQRQGPRARYVGIRKNLFDLRRAAVIQNLETAQRKAA